MNTFEMVSPESLGIARKGIEDFLTAAAKAGLELHRLMILRHGRCCAKITWSPYGEEDLHPVYSFSKSLTATAIGFAWQEGLLTLDEKIADLFPEDLPPVPDENLLSCTIHHLLCMSCGHETAQWDSSPSWRKSFFAQPFLHKPGSFYLYNTAGSNLLACIIKKKTGMQVTEYLKDRLFVPLGMSDVYCAELPDEYHTQIGGAGMKLKLEDMARFTQFMLQDGFWEGKPLLKGWFMAQAGTKQIETAGDSEGHIKEWAKGYGYQCWMGSFPGSFRADGAYGQFGLVYPGLDTCIIINAATEQTQTIMDAVNNCLLPNISGDEGTSPGQDDPTLQPLIREYSLPVLLSCRNPVFEEKLNHSVYRVVDGSAMCGLRQLVGGAGLFETFGPDPVSEIRFCFREGLTEMLLTEGSTVYKLAAATDGRFAFSEAGGIRYAACARWRSLRRLEMEIRRTDAMSGVRLIFSFSDANMEIETDETLMSEGGLGMICRPLSSFRLG